MEWLGGIAIVTVGVLLVAFRESLVSWLKGRRTLQDQLTKAIEELFIAKNDILSLKDDHHACERGRLEDRAEMAAMIRRIGHLEQGTGLGPGEPRVGIVVADLKGQIKVFSPTLTPFLRWLPEEVIGKFITILMPPEETEKHAKAFMLFVQDEHRATDSTRVIFTEAWTKTKERVKVRITLDGWQVGSEGLITATIRERMADDLILPASPLILPPGTAKK